MSTNTEIQTRWNETNYLAYVLLIFSAVVLIATGLMDADWQLVSYRFNEWHRSVDYWEYCPYVKINWHLAWMINLGRFVVGSLVLGFIIGDLRWRLKTSDDGEPMGKRSREKTKNTVHVVEAEP